MMRQVWGEDFAPVGTRMGNSNTHLLNGVGVGIIIFVSVGTRYEIIKSLLYIYVHFTNPNFVSFF